MVRVSVIIPHYDDLDNLKSCLEALSRQTLSGKQVEVIVAENNSPIGISEVAAAAGPAAIVIPAFEQGPGPARNAGVAVAKGAVLAFIDADCRPDPSWLEQGLAAIPEADVVGGKIRVAEVDAGRPGPVEAFEAVFAMRNERHVAREGYSVTANMFVRRSVFAAVGGFGSERSEDLEWGQRARRRGFSIRYAPGAVVTHPARRTWSDLVGNSRRLTRDAYLRACNERFGRTRWFIGSWLALLAAFPHLVRVMSAPELSSAASRYAAAGILFRIRAFRFIEANRLLFWGIGNASGSFRHADRTSSPSGAR